MHSDLSWSTSILPFLEEAQPLIEPVFILGSELYERTFFTGFSPLYSASLIALLKAELVLIKEVTSHWTLLHSPKRGRISRPDNFLFFTDCVKIEHGSSGSVGGTLLRGSRSKAELQELMETLQRRKSALEASLRAAECSRKYLSAPPPMGSQSTRPPSASRTFSYMTSSSVPPSPRQGDRQLSPNGLLRHSHPRHQSQH